jgi:hypothetical protein
MTAKKRGAKDRRRRANDEEALAALEKAGIVTRGKGRFEDYPTIRLKEPGILVSQEILRDRR